MNSWNSRDVGCIWFELKDFDSKVAKRQLPLLFSSFSLCFEARSCKLYRRHALVAIPVAPFSFSFLLSVLRNTPHFCELKNRMASCQEGFHQIYLIRSEMGNAVEMALTLDYH